LFEGSILVSGASEAIREFSDKHIVPEKLVAEYVEQMRKEKMKEENRRERMERLNREYNDIDWVGLYNSDKLSSLTVNKLSLYLSHHLQRKESGKGCNNQSAHWQLAVQFYGASTTSEAPVKKYATTSDFITFRDRN